MSDDSLSRREFLRELAQTIRETVKRELAFLEKRVSAVELRANAVFDPKRANGTRMLKMTLTDGRVMTIVTTIEGESPTAPLDEHPLAVRRRVAEAAMNELGIAPKELGIAPK